MIRKALILELFSATNIQRWNEVSRPIELNEMDKQAHAFMLSYFFSHLEGIPTQDTEPLIRRGIYRLLQKIWLTDIQKPVLDEVEADAVIQNNIRTYLKQQGELFLSSLSLSHAQEALNTGFEQAIAHEGEDVFTRIQGVAHAQASLWEVHLLNDQQLRNRVEKQYEAERQTFQTYAESHRSAHDAERRKNVALAPQHPVNLQDLVDTLGGFRYQIRWGNRQRLPKTSVLGHSLFVALLTYLFAWEYGLPASERAWHFWAALFHDLPELYTRDVISPVKEALGQPFKDKLAEIEVREIHTNLFPLIPEGLHAEILFFTQDEFTDRDYLDTRVLGTLVRQADKLAAFVEAHQAIANGSRDMGFYASMIDTREKVLAQYKKRDDVPCDSTQTEPLKCPPRTNKELYEQMQKIGLPQIYLDFE